MSTLHKKSRLKQKSWSVKNSILEQVESEDLERWALSEDAPFKIIPPIKDTCEHPPSRLAIYSLFIAAIP